MPTDPSDTPEGPVAAGGDALSQLCDDVADVIQGYAVMEKRADPDLQPVVQRLLALHRTQAADLRTALQERGARPGDSGSVMGAVHAAVATARDWFGSLDTSALPRIVDGEERLIGSYDQALDAVSGPGALRDLLIYQRAALQAQIDVLRSD